MGILKAVAAAQNGLTLVDLSKSLDSPKSTLLGLLRPLTEDGFLHHADRRYHIGKDLFALAAQIQSARKITTLLRSHIEQLREKTGETVMLALVDLEREVISYVEVLESRKQVRYAIPAGVTRPLYASAASQLLLAYQDEGWCIDYLARIALEPLTPKTITKPRTLAKRLQAIRSDGLAFSDSEAVEGAAGIAAPVFDTTGNVVAALAIGAPAERARKYKHRWCKIIKELAASASRSLGQGVNSKP